MAVVQEGLSSLFKVAFFTLLGLGLLLIGGAVLFSVLIPNPTEIQETSSDNLWKIGTYAFAGLVGLVTGKVA